MIFPRSADDLKKRVKNLIDTCVASRQDRADLYRRRESYFLYGSGDQRPIKYNRIEPHLDLVSAFLYSPDHAFFNIAAERNAADAVIKQVTALQDSFNDDFQDEGLSDLFAEAIPWSLVYDTMVIKLGWSDVRDSLTAELIPPHNFGVYREDVSDLDKQLAFTHTYHLDWHESAQRLIAAGKGAEIPRIGVTNQPFVTPFPDLLNRLIISTTGGTNIAGNIAGQINPIYSPPATYQPRVDAPVVEWTELWAWDSECQDFRIFHMCEPDILISDSLKTVDALRKAARFKAKRAGADADKFFKTPCNLFLPRDHPFVQVCPYTKFNYFWGISHTDGLIPLQDWMTERLDQIADMLERQAYPARVGSGFSGLTDEKMEAFGGADTFLFDQLPGAQVKELAPQMPPDLFADYQSINGLFLEKSGLTDVIMGTAEGGRSRQQQKAAQKTGAGRIKRTALKLERSLTRMGDIALKLKQKNDDDQITPEADEQGQAHPFVAAQVASDIKLRVEGHSHSPLFGDESREMAVLLRKSQAIDNELFVRMLNPPAKDAILHSQRLQARKQQQMLQEHPELLEKMVGRGGGGARRK